jgi:DNA polymerase-3 subunit beta
MKFTVTTGKIQASLAAVTSVVPTKLTLPVLGNILIEAGSKQLKLSATDLEISITTTLEANLVKKGSIAIPARTFTDIISALPETEIEIEAVSNRIEMRFAGGDYKISGMSAEEFPKLPEVNLSKEIKLPAQLFQRMVTKSSFAVSSDETRPALNGVLWQSSGEKMKMVATDGHRLAKIQVDNTKLQGLYDDVIIPPRALNLVTKLADDGASEVGVIFGENNIVFVCGANTIASRLIEGPYPNYEQVIPASNDNVLLVSKSQLAESVRRVAILSNALTRQVKFSIGAEELKLSATNVDLGGEATETIPCSYDGKEMEIGYNANYVIDILKQIDGDEAKFALSSPVAAGVVTSVDNKDDYLCLIMPLRLAD